MTKYLTNLAGLNFRPKEAKDLVKALEPGMQVNLEREPENPWDSNAIKVMATTGDPGDPNVPWGFIGYVEKLANGPIAQDLDAGMQANCFIEKVYHPLDDDDPKAWMRPLISIETYHMPVEA